KNPIDAIWEDQPEPPLAPVEIHPIGFAGELAKDKLARLAESIGKDGATHTVLTDPSSIAWAFDIRGGDVPHTPLALGFAVLAADRSHLLLMDQRKFSRTVAAYLTQLAELHEPGEFEAVIAALAKGGAGAVDLGLVFHRARDAGRVWRGDDGAAIVLDQHSELLRRQHRIQRDLRAALG
ncbi:MAG: aminopeptidase P family protein, partial [Mesorhizobium sp.]